jgi:hypothetical protein
MPGLVISYSYLWRDEAMRGLDEGRKDRPCVVILTVETVDGNVIVTVAPITHTTPAEAGGAIILPMQTKARLGLDQAPSWIIATDLNRFTWPGVDLRPVRRGADRCDYGKIPGDLLRQVRDKAVEMIRSRRTALTSRDT